jgi:hypothetical protein
MGPLEPRFYTPPQKRVSADAEACLPQVRLPQVRLPQEKFFDAGVYHPQKKKKGLFKGLFKQKKGLTRDTSITRNNDDGSVSSVDNAVYLPQKRKGLARDTSFTRNDSVGSVDNGVYLLQKRKGLVRDTSFTKMNDDDSCAAYTQYFCM